MISSALLVLASLAPAALANVFITAPVGTTNWQAGQQQTITWQDDNSSPSLADFGDAKISIYTGNANQQTLLQAIATSVNVATTASVVFTPDATIGPNGDDYFIRIESLNLKDANNSQFPAEAFSAKFTLSSMTGTFNASVQAEVDGTSTAPIGGSATAGASSGASSQTSSRVFATSSGSHSGSASATGSAASHSASSTATTSGASKHPVAGVSFIAAVGALLAATQLL
ncbi:hypothetical protein PUNSTDRAFT_96536 [Punctularia strigosozonata HHB-11173 SS5]|uniref:uncharacterized protein n=1 Tax=Punctularia strigosozonata (strain HHB-11173) TaxID=741275 RepID=UPI00044179F7|nr:uncharacterized protein PUNSTDRAFT_96536 [Punctularia strigosozonata HHB-11173 SS5]EIN14574.1 hypothetical protein PUNSTDRAFT_96536 [Punctularia strigosozonata HHB-11173 SS5]